MSKFVYIPRKLRIENQTLVEVMAFDILTTVQMRY